MPKLSLKGSAKNILRDPMLAEQHIIMYRDECEGDLMAVSYVPDLTAAHNLRSKDAALEPAEAANRSKTVCLDRLMPDMNGVGVVRRIRIEIGDETPIIILSAYDWSEIEEAIEAGVTAFCSKPIFQSELLEIITKYYSNGKEKEDKKNDVISTVSDLAGRKILLAEDNELNQEIAAAILEEAGFSVDIVSDGDEAVERIRCAEEGQYDVVLMDVQMPNMDGYTATREIRALDSPMASVPIVAMTANAFELWR